MAGRPKNKIASKRFSITLKKPVYKHLIHLSEMTDIKTATLASSLLSDLLPAVEMMVSSMIMESKNEEQKMLHVLDDAVLFVESKLEEMTENIVDINKKHGGVLKHKASFDNLITDNNKGSSDDRLDIGSNTVRP